MIKSLTPGVLIIGCSSGGMKALFEIFDNIDKPFSFPVVIIQHLALNAENMLLEVLNKKLNLTFLEAKDGEQIKSGKCYIAPGGFHLLMEENQTFSLSLDERVLGCRPAIDITLLSAIDAFSGAILAIILTGNNSDGAKGAEAVENNGGQVIVQNIESASFPAMPRAAIQQTKCAEELTLMQINTSIKAM
ncbi:MAG: chemotaxis protein CheB [Colwellia sp.]|nr:chemotaxis protein CheB [Colwellia sp.]